MLLVSATDEQQLLERETPNPTLSAPIKRTQRVSHLSGAVSRDTQRSNWGTAAAHPRGGGAGTDTLRLPPRCVCAAYRVLECAAAEHSL